MRTEWPLSLFSFSNYAFDVHTVSVSMSTEWPLSLFSNYVFDVHVHTVSVSMRTMTVIIILKLRIWRTHIQCINDELKDRYRYFQTTHLTYTQCINEGWIDCCLLTKWLGVKETKNHNRLLYLGKLWNFTHIAIDYINVSPCESRDDDSFLAVCSF